MAWPNGRSGYRQPPGWTRIRKAILKRDGRVCYLCGMGGASEVDHIVPVSAGGSHDPINLAAVHAGCHKQKTQVEAAEAKRFKTKQRSQSLHPGHKRER